VNYTQGFDASAKRRLEKIFFYLTATRRASAAHDAM